uniref:J domain-containing protein n=2 Tax=Parascaris TaxID=6254 RepID=A0A914ZQD2_PARUN
MQNRMQQHLMFSASFHANFIDPHTHILEMGRADLDISPDDEGKFGEPFRVGIRVHIEDVDRGFNTNDAPFLSYDSSAVSRMILFSHAEEYDALQRQVGVTKQSASSRPARPPRPLHSPQVLRAHRKEDAADRLLPPEESRPPLQGDSFFATLQWNDAGSANTGVTYASSVSPDLPEVQPGSLLHEQKGQHHVPQQLAEKQQEHELLTCSQPQAPSASVLRSTGMDKAETYERMYGIRVSGTNETFDKENEKYKFDYEKTPKQPVAEDQTAQLATDIDLLGLGDMNTSSSAPNAVSNSTELSFDPFAHFENNAATNANLFGHKSASSAAFCNNQQRVDDTEVDDLLQWSSSTTNSVMHDRIAGLSVHSSGMQRNVSAPSFATEQSNITAAPVFDPFAEFLASTSSEQVSKSNQGSKNNLFSGSGVNSGRATPSPQRPNYNRAHFDAINSIGGVKPKLTENAFDDLLTSQGFSSSSRNTKTMDQMKRADEAKTMDPVAIKIRDWTNGKERNIRALLGSLNDVLWEDADKWNQPSMGDLLTALQVKRFYRKACLVIHPDKQIGTENEALARAIFTELNDAWTAFENAGSPSL